MRVRRIAIVLLLLAAAGCRNQPEIPRLFPVPDAHLVDETGRPVNLASLHGEVVVYDFIFTTCQASCPIMTNNMRALTQKVPKDAKVRFVSISVDPTHDTPPVLAAYAKRMRNDPRWMFLTGNRDDIVNLAVKGFKLAASDPTPGGEPLLHSAKFAVADKEGVIRGYFDGSDASSTDEVARIIDALSD